MTFLLHHDAAGVGAFANGDGVAIVRACSAAAMVVKAQPLGQTVNVLACAGMAKWRDAAQSSTASRHRGQTASSSRHRELLPLPQSTDVFPGALVPILRWRDRAPSPLAPLVGSYAVARVEHPAEPKPDGARTPP